MLTEQVITRDACLLRPHRYILVSGLVAALALTTPVFAVAYWLTITPGTWMWPLGLHVLAALVGALLVFRFHRTAVVVSPQGVVERGFLGRINQISTDEISALYLVEIYRDSTLDTQPNLFIIDKDGALRIRLRGQYWSRESMEELAEVVDRPLTNLSDSIRLADMRQSRPEWLYWFERLPVISWI